MKFTAKQYAVALYEALESTKPSEVGKILDNFVKVLAENNDLKLAPQVIDEVHKLTLRRRGVKQVKVISAHELSKPNEQAIVETLNRFMASKVELKKQIDEQLVGGVVIEVDDLLIDGSLKNALDELKESLIYD